MTEYINRVYIVVKRNNRHLQAKNI